LAEDELFSTIEFNIKLQLGTTMKLVKPPALQSGHNVGVIALSNSAQGLKIEYRQRAYHRIKEHFGWNGEL
jgi:hypothetical protein